MVWWSCWNHEAMLRGGGVGFVEVPDAVATAAATAAVASLNRTVFTSMSSDDRLLISSVFSRSGASCVLTRGIKPRNDSWLSVCCVTDTDIDKKRQRIMAKDVANDPPIILWHPFFFGDSSWNCSVDLKSTVAAYCSGCVNMRKPNLFIEPYLLLDSQHPLCHL